MVKDQKRVQVIYSGYVQGVGFRFAAVRVASQYDITGFVKNLPDGNVIAVAEGSKHQLDAFLESLGKEMIDYIRDSQVEWEPPTGEFGSFGIKF